MSKENRKNTIKKLGIALLIAFCQPIHGNTETNCKEAYLPSVAFLTCMGATHRKKIDLYDSIAVGVFCATGTGIIQEKTLKDKPSHNTELYIAAGLLILQAICYGATSIC